jgi:PadR family transcriptional regulator, regulatory protein PadR
MDRERLKGNLDLLLLSVLSAGPAHGYAIISAPRDRSEGTFDLPEGTIYPALHRLEDAGLLASSWAHVEGRRRNYGLTDKGAAALAAEQVRWRNFAAECRRYSAGPPPGVPPLTGPWGARHAPGADPPAARCPGACATDRSGSKVGAFDKV